MFAAIREPFLSTDRQGIFGSLIGMELAMRRNLSCAFSWCCLVLGLAGGAPAQDLALYVFGAHEETATRITAEPLEGLRHCGASDWSPDGKRFLFDAMPGKQFNRTKMFVANFPVNEGAKFTDLAGLAMSPDGRYLLFVSSRK
jgi:Tol biopolymer transport system component